jgi:hypothetical protein
VLFLGHRDDASWHEHLGCRGCQQKQQALDLKFQRGSSGGGLLGGGDGCCCGSLLRYKQELQAPYFLFSGWTGDGSGRLGCYVAGDGLLQTEVVFRSAVRGDGGSLFKRGDSDGRGNGGILFRRGGGDNLCSGGRGRRIIMTRMRVRSSFFLKF